MKKIIFLKLLLAVSLLTSCYDDDVVFVNETDNLRINKLFEFIRTLKHLETFIYV